MQRRRASRRDNRSPFRGKISAIWDPMLRTGFNDVAGSCGTNPTVLPRSRHHCRSLRPSTSRPAMANDPAVILAAAGSNPTTALAKVVLPEPDSPTTATNSPGDTARSRRSSATLGTAPG